MINQAVILVGGKGLRLGKITKKTPKPLLKIKGKPIIKLLIEKLVKKKKRLGLSRKQFLEFRKGNNPASVKSCRRLH